MSDQTDSSQAAPEAEVAKPQPSATPEGDAGDSLDATKLVQAILANDEASELMRRQFQSDKDKGIAKALTEAEEAKSMFQQIAERLNVDQSALQEAQREAFIDSLMKSGGLEQATVAQPVDNGMLTGEAAWQAASSIMGGVPAELQKQIQSQMTSKTFTDPQSVQAFAMTAMANITAQPAGNPAAAISPAGGSGSVSPDIDSLTAELEELQVPRLMKNPESKKRRAELLKAIEELEQST